MSVRSTTVPSRAQTYCCFSREPQPPPCSRLKDTAACAWVAVYSLTGIDTMPKVTVSDANARAAIRVSSAFRSESGAHRAKILGKLQLWPFLFSLRDGFRRLKRQQ